MKTKIKHITLIAAMLLLSFVATAQPLPPSTPFGSPVPVGGAVFILVAAMAGLGIKLLIKKNKFKQGEY